MNPLYEIYEKCKKENFSCKLNSKRTNIIFEHCIFCGNPNWNLELELEEKFVFHCWACHESGTAFYLLSILGIDSSCIIDAVPKRQRELSSKAAKIFYSYQERNIEEVLLALYSLGIQKTDKMKLISPENPFEFKGFKVEFGVMILGLNSKGLMVVNLKNKETRKFYSDIYLYSVKQDRRLAIVEGFFDLWPFYKGEAVILGSTHVSNTVKKEFLDLIKNYNEVYLSLDREAYEWMKNFLISNWKKEGKNFYILEPEMHSPSESDIIFLKEIY